MSLPVSRGAYHDCIKIMDEALKDEKGVRVEFPSQDAAIYFRMRMHQARKINRRDNAATYEKDHPLYNASLYDQLVGRIVNHEGTFWLYLEKNRIEDLGEIQPLSEVPQITHHRQMQIPDMREQDDGVTYEVPEPKPVAPGVITKRRF